MSTYFLRGLEINDMLDITIVDDNSVVFLNMSQ